LDFPEEQSISVIPQASRTTLEHKESPVQWVPRSFSQGIKRRERETVTNLHLMTRIRMLGDILQVSNMSSWCVQELSGFTALLCTGTIWIYRAAEFKEHQNLFFMIYLGPSSKNHYFTLRCNTFIFYIY
jgi:hypothetical protein